MKSASIVNEAYFVEQRKRLRKQLKPIALWFNDFSLWFNCGLTILVDHFTLY